MGMAGGARAMVKHCCFIYFFNHLLLSGGIFFMYERNFIAKVLV